MRVLVTGGAGFIGSHVVERLLDRTADVRVLDDLSTGSLDNLSTVRPRINFIEGSILDTATVRRAMEGVTHLFHASAIRSVPKSVEHPLLCHRVNVNGTAELFQAAKEAGVGRIVFASSSAVYADSSCAMQEEDAPAPQSPYGISKWIGEIYAGLYRDLYRLPVVCLRYFNVYGPRMGLESGYSMAVPQFIDSLSRDLAPPVYGDGLQSRDFIYVDDVARATVDALFSESLRYSVYNIGSGSARTILDLVKILNQQLKKNITPNHLPGRPGEPRQTLADISRARSDMEFSPRLSLEQGLLKTIEWFRQPAGWAR